jgi:peptidoglycan/LPS O-acetylase OafA/YrhL
MAFDAVFVVLALVLLAAGVLDAAGGQIAVGTVEIVIAICVSLIFGTSLVRRFRPKELGLLDALGAAGVFAVFGLLGLSATLSGDAVRTTFGAIAAAILLPLSALIVISLLRSRRGTRRAVQDL